MKNKAAIAILSLIAGMSFFSSCGLGLSPLKDGSARTSVSLTLSSLGADASGNVSRAVMPGSDFLYIRTIGIPGKTEGALYGPYSVASGSRFVTTEIPAGEYDSVYVLCSGKDLESDGNTYAFFGGSYTFHGLMSLPDAQMKAFVSDETEKSSLDPLLDGQVSFGTREGVIISQGKENSLSFTLIPITSMTYELDLDTTQVYAFSSGTRARHFYRLSDVRVSLPVTAGNLSCTISSENASSATLSSVAFFSSTGAEIPVTKSGTDLPSGITWTIEPATINSIADPDGTVELYQYLDYSGVISSQYRNTAGGVLVSFDGDPTPSFQNHRLLVAIYGPDAMASISAGLPWENIPALAYAIVPLDSAGDGSLLIPASVAQGATCYISAQVDTGGNYASLANLDSVDIATIVPYRGDYLTNGTNGLIPFTGGQSVSLSAADFSPYTDYVYFVSQDGSSVADGSTLANRTTLDHALSMISLLSPTETAQIYLDGSISGQGTMDIAHNVYISAYGSAARAIASFNSYLGAIPYINVLTGGSLTLKKVSIDCSLLTGSPDSLIKLADNANSHLQIDYGSSLIGPTGCPGPMHGAGVYVGSGCSLTMQGSAIQQCKITQTGSLGAAVYVATGGTATLRSATFANNSTSGLGVGIVYVDGTVYAGSVTFTSNTGTDHAGAGSWNPLP